MYNKNYSGFAYLPEVFRMTNNRLETNDLTMCTTCIDHAQQVKMIESESTFYAAERYVCAKCCLTPDESSPMVVRDDNFEKVPQTNAALRHVLLTCGVFKCLTMFSTRSSSTPVRSTHFSLCGYELASDNWFIHLLTNMYATLKNVSLGYQECSLATQHVAQKQIKQLLFFLILCE